MLNGGVIDDPMEARQLRARLVGTAPSTQGEVARTISDVLGTSPVVEEMRNTLHSTNLDNKTHQDRLSQHLDLITKEVHEIRELSFSRQETAKRKAELEAEAVGWTVFVAAQNLAEHLASSSSALLLAYAAKDVAKIISLLIRARPRDNQSHYIYSQESATGYRDVVAKVKLV